MVVADVVSGVRIGRDQGWRIRVDQAHPRPRIRAKPARGKESIRPRKGVDPPEGRSRSARGKESIRPRIGQTLARGSDEPSGGIRDGASGGMQACVHIR
jgi:hypothetical protein